MIHESYYWRNELIKISKRTKRKIQYEKVWSNLEYSKFEKDIMFGFYIIRKLLESNKLSSDFNSLKLECKVYPSNGNLITLMNKHHFHECYELNSEKVEKKELRFFINQFVHSYIFSPIIDLADENEAEKLNDENLNEEEYYEMYGNASKELKGIFFNSDDNKNKFIFKIDILTIIELFRKVGNCHVTKIEMRYDEHKKDYIYVCFSENKKPLKK